MSWKNTLKYLAHASLKFYGGRTRGKVNLNFSTSVAFRNAATYQKPTTYIGGVDDGHRHYVLSTFGTVRSIVYPPLRAMGSLKALWKRAGKCVESSITQPCIARLC